MFKPMRRLIFVAGLLGTPFYILGQFMYYLGRDIRPKQALKPKLSACPVARFCAPGGRFFSKLGSSFHKVPSLAILQQPAFWRFGADTNCIFARDHGGWEDVPAVPWEHVGGEEINLLG